MFITLYKIGLAYSIMKLASMLNKDKLPYKINNKQYIAEIKNKFYIHIIITYLKTNLISFRRLRNISAAILVSGSYTFYFCELPCKQIRRRILTWQIAQLPTQLADPSVLRYITIFLFSVIKHLLFIVASDMRIRNVRKGIQNTDRISVILCRLGR